MATKKKSVAKKTAAKRPVAKKVAAKTRTTKSVKPMESFKAYKDKPPFMTFRITEQTIYWAVLFIYVFALSLWVLQIQMDILDITNAIN